MSSYKEFRAQAKRRRMKRVAVRVALIIVILALVFAACYFAIVMFAGGDLFGLLKNKDNSDIIGSDLDTLPTSSQVTSEPQSPQEENIISADWNTPIPQPRTVNAEATYISDYRILAVPASGKVNEEYFKNALFIGDSLTQGMGLYDKALNNGRTNVCAYIGAGPKTITENASAKKGRNNYVNPHDEIFAVQPDNIYILFGTNTIVSAITDEGFIAQYAEMLDFLKSRFDPKVNFYIQGMPPVTAKTAAERPKMNNERIRDLNSHIARIATERGMYYIDLQEALAGEDGNLPVEISNTSDGFHLKPDGYVKWIDYLASHTVHNPMNEKFYVVPPAAG